MALGFASTQSARIARYSSGWKLQTFPPGEYDLRRLVYEAHPEKAGFKLENLSVYSHPHMPLGDYVYVFENSGKAYVYNEDCQLREYIP